VLHTAATATSALAEILDRAGSLPAVRSVRPSEMTCRHAGRQRVRL
jgi:hypothetical protein